MEYPVNLQLKGRRCAVVGGGSIALRKVETLLAAGALVTVMAPAVTEGLAKLADKGLISWINSLYQEGGLSGYFIVICATDNAAVNAAAAAEARSRGALVNVVDTPELCDFTLPACITSGDLLLTVSTGGKSPVLARRLREELQALYGPEYGQFLEQVSQAREKVRKRLALPRDREEFWRNAVDKDVIALLRQRKLKEAEERLHNAISRIGTES